MITKEVMDRKEFLMKIGVRGGALLAVLTAGCLGGCTSQSINPIVNMSLDLTSPENAPLLKNGGFIIKNQVVVAKTTSGSFVAVTQVCSHQGEVRVTYLSNSNTFYCPVHGAEYDTSGKGLNGDGRGGLTVYTTSLSGNILSIKN